MSVIDEQHARAELAGEPLAAVRVDVGDRDAHASLAEPAHDRVPDQCRAARDDRRLAAQPAHCRPAMIARLSLRGRPTVAAAGRRSHDRMNKSVLSARC